MGLTCSRRRAEENDEDPQEESEEEQQVQPSEKEDEKKMSGLCPGLSPTQQAGEFSPLSPTRHAEQAGRTSSDEKPSSRGPVPAWGRSVARGRELGSTPLEVSQSQGQ